MEVHRLAKLSHFILIAVLLSGCWPLIPYRVSYDEWMDYECVVEVKGDPFLSKNERTILESLSAECESEQIILGNLDQKFSIEIDVGKIRTPVKCSDLWTFTDCKVYGGVHLQSNFLTIAPGESYRIELKAASDKEFKINQTTSFNLTGITQGLKFHIDVFVTPKRKSGYRIHKERFTVGL